MTFSNRTEPCETCNGTRYLIDFRTYAGEAVAGEPVELPCPDCVDGTQDRCCDICDMIAPLNEDGECEDCSSFTETVSDPLNGREAA